MAVTQRVINANGQKIRKIVRGTLHTGAEADRIVASANMKVGAYTVAAQPYGPSRITVTATAGDTADTMGTVVIVGTDIYDRAITETVTPVAGSAVYTTKYFKTITSVTGAGWVIDGAEGTNDTITVGIPAAGGIQVEGQIVSLYVLTGNCWINPNAVAVADTTAIPLIAGDSIENLLVSDTLSLISDNSGGTYYAMIYEF